MLDKLRRWWNKDATEVAKEEAQMTQHDRDLAEEDYEERKDDMSIPGSYAGGAVAGTDFEADSEKPRP